MTRVDILMEGLNKAIPSGGKSQYSVDKWREVAESLDNTLLEYESKSDPDLQNRLTLTIAQHDGANPREMAAEIIKELERRPAENV